MRMLLVFELANLTNSIIFLCKWAKLVAIPSSFHGNFPCSKLKCQTIKLILIIRNIINMEMINLEVCIVFTSFISFRNSTEMRDSVHPPVSVYRNQTHSAPIVKTRVKILFINNQNIKRYCTWESLN